MSFPPKTFQSFQVFKVGERRQLHRERISKWNKLIVQFRTFRAKTHKFAEYCQWKIRLFNIGKLGYRFKKVLQTLQNLNMQHERPDIQRKGISNNKIKKNTSVLATLILKLMVYWPVYYTKFCLDVYFNCIRKCSHTAIEGDHCNISRRREGQRNASSKWR